MTSPRWTAHQVSAREAEPRRVDLTVQDRILAGVIAAPDRVVYAFLTAALPVGVAVAFGVFHPALVIPAIVIAVVVLWRWTPSNYLDSGRAATTDQRTDVVTATRRAQHAALGTGLIVVFLALWLWINRHYYSQYMNVTRDPSIYTLRAMWLVDHPSSIIDVHTAAAAAAGVPGTDVGSLAFPAIDGKIFPQSNGLVPGLLAVAGWVGGTRAILLGNLIIGALGLLAVYAFARRLLGPLWALAPAVALGLCMPLISVTRSPYSEPTALVAVFGGLTLLWTSWYSRKWSHFLVAGLLLGVSALARIDAGATVIGVLAGFGVVALGARSTAVRRQAAVRATAFFVGSGLCMLLGILDGLINSKVYLEAEADNLVPLTIVTAFGWLVVVGIAFLPLALFRDWLGTRSQLLGKVVFIAALVIGLLMISRPLWWTAHFIEPQTYPTIEAMERGSGLPIDGGRSFDESSVNWLSMYLGWPAVILGAFGGALLATRIVRLRESRTAVFTATIACVSALYLNRISIFPDQIWAMRRFIPVIIPGLLVAATYVLWRMAKRWSGLKWLAGSVAAVVVAGSIAPWTTVWTTANFQGQLQEMVIGCAAVGDRSVILAGPHPAPAWFLPTFTIGCHRPTVSYEKATPQGMAQIGRQFGGAQVAVVTFDPKSVSWSTPVPGPVNSGVFPVWEQPLQRVPAKSNNYTRSMWVGVLQPDGRVAALPTGR